MLCIDQKNGIYVTPKNPHGARLPIHVCITVYAKECPVCRVLVRFQEYQSGFHNFNDKVLLSVPLCSLLTTGLSNHIAVGRLLRTLESHSRATVPYNTLRKAFYHFCALREYTYGYFCYRCGHHPPVLIGDTNWKVAFDLPVHLMRRPDLENCSPQDTQVNVAARWENLEKEIIATGFCEDTSSNPFSSPLTYSVFTPWIGKHSRINDVVPKTEIFKGLSQKYRESSRKANLEIDEDQILQLLDCKQPKKEDLVQACTDLGVSTTGSQTDLINRLEELLLYKEIYPKMFVKLQKAGGGVLHMGCTHGVVFYQSPLWWKESARDHGDALLSFKYPPTVFISDIAGRVARHVNNRTQQMFFQPHDGRVCAPTEDNIREATTGNLKINPVWVQNLRQKSRGPVENTKTDRFSTAHPETGTPERYSLYDRFHEKNQKRPEERLRSLKLLPDLASLLNSAVAEQINRELSSIRYSLCQMKDTYYMFSLRLYFHLHNERLNNTFLNQVQKHSLELVHIGLHGKLLLAKAEPSQRPPENQVRVQECTVTSDGEEQNNFSVSMFPIDEQHKERLTQLYAVQRRENLIIARFSRYATLELRDLKSLCPPHLLQDSGKCEMPWLTDNAVSCRLAQIAGEAQNVVALSTDTFILWHRDWIASKKIEESHVKVLENSQKILCPRIVGKGDSPERGCHFIIWVFDVPAKEIRIYDNTQQYVTIRNSDMDILKEAFKQYESLEGWTVSNPHQWTKNDGYNCGVFVCTMAEMEAKHLKMCPEVLHTGQLLHLRIYHATCMVKNLQTEDFPPEMGLGDGISENRCMAQDIKVCVFQKVGKKAMHPHVKEVEWIQCDICNGWLHTDCAGIIPATVTKDTPFSCGCNMQQPYLYESTLSLIKKGLLVNLLMEDHEIMVIYIYYCTPLSTSCVTVLHYVN
ncbi:HMG domain-containing protein 3-like [Astyanax mexicanus]|uniref:HMG domain-containing protein 3-like n=1 Tax=Astyanax mexicanus TaxID=7994 RepID=A0A8T2MHV6_ASTMX|nr:HMG domain-containing protein 3-like [Astyanax mexicanus]